jgi:hypothetical protein
VTSSVFTPDLTSSPLQLPTMTRDLKGLEIISAPNMMPLALDGSNILQPVGEPLFLGAWSKTVSI